MTTNLTRRELIAGAGAGAVAALLQRDAGAQVRVRRAVVFTHATVVTVDAVRDDTALAVQDDKIAAIARSPHPGLSKTAARQLAQLSTW